MKNIIIVILIIFLMSLGKAVVRLENYHYANFLGFCAVEDMEGFSEPQKRIKQEECLSKVQTRTSSLWHIYYAVMDN